MGCRFHFCLKWEHNGVPILKKDWDWDIICCNIPILLGSWLDRDSQGSSNHVPYAIKQPNRRVFCYFPWSALWFPLFFQAPELSLSLPGLCVAQLLCWHLVVEQQLCNGDLLSGNYRMCCFQLNVHFSSMSWEWKKEQTHRAEHLSQLLLPVLVLFSRDGAWMVHTYSVSLWK